MRRREIAILSFDALRIDHNATSLTISVLVWTRVLHFLDAVGLSFVVDGYGNVTCLRSRIGRGIVPKTRGMAEVSTCGETYWMCLTLLAFSHVVVPF